VDLSKDLSDQDRKLKKTWANYWKNYHGVTKIGDWSQRQALSKLFLVIKKERIKKNIKIVDVGCGEGRTLKAFISWGYKNIFGIDNTIESLKICQKNGLKIGKDVFLVEATKTNFIDREFELVFSEGLLEHFKDPSLAIKEICRISKKYILLIQPNHYSLYGLAISVLGYFLRNNIREYSFSKNYFIQRFKNLGFVLKLEKYTPLGEFFILLFERK